LSPGKSSHLQSFLSSLPYSGISKLLLTGISIILTVIISSPSEDYAASSNINCLILITIYITFSVSGILVIIIFYSSKDLLPRNFVSFSLVISFLVELSGVFADNSKDFSDPTNNCLLVTIVCCLISAVLMIISNNNISTFSLVMFTIIQGTWLIQSTIISSSESISYLYFSWHVLAVFILMIVINVVKDLHSITQGEKHKKIEHSNRIDTVAHRLNVKHSVTNEQIKMLKDSKMKKSEENLSDKEVTRTKTEDIESESEGSDASVPTLLQSLPSDRGERMSPLEEFNSLHSHTEVVRKTIQMKDSSVV